MTLSAFIERHLDEIVAEWEVFARSLLAAPQAMSDLALRDHGREILIAIAQEMQTPQSEAQRSTKAKGTDPTEDQTPTAAATHGALRQMAGFDLVQLVAEFRAMRASVLALWRKSHEGDGDGALAIEEIARFNEGIDQALAESVNSYSTRVETSREMFLAVLGHDLRGPLSAISLSNALMARADLPDHARSDATRRIARAVASMSGLVNDLLDFTRTRLGAGLPIEATACDLRAVCDDAVDAARTSYPASRFVLNADQPIAVLGDVPRLHQALSNLLGNAVQHGDRREPVVITATADATGARLTIQNAGRPISADALKVVFEPLVQAESAGAEPHERSKTSMGLGLFIVREIVRGHGGSIEVESSQAGGTVFAIRLPLDRAGAPG